MERVRIRANEWEEANCLLRGRIFHINSYWKSCKGLCKHDVWFPPPVLPLRDVETVLVTRSPPQSLVVNRTSDVFAGVFAARSDLRTMSTLIPESLCPTVNTGYCGVLRLSSVSTINTVRGVFDTTCEVTALCSLTVMQYFHYEFSHMPEFWFPRLGRFDVTLLVVMI